MEKKDIPPDLCYNIKNIPSGDGLSLIGRADDPIQEVSLLKFDAFSAGVEPGGLRSKNEIRILLCYLLSTVDAAFTKAEILSIMQENGLANYFEITDVLSELIEKKTIDFDPDTKSCRATDTARMIAKQLDNVVPSSVRERAVSAALNLLARTRREQENRVEIRKTEQGYNVECHISGGDMDLMSFCLYVPDHYQAQLVKENFHRDPEAVYRILLALVTRNFELADGILRSSKE